jgi:hypothetical protein
MSSSDHGISPSPMVMSMSLASEFELSFELFPLSATDCAWS